MGAELATIVLGVLIFIDDYFNCLTVGSVMRPVTDKHHVSRAKLAYLIDATAAPVCIIAPISSWAAAVSQFVEGEDGLSIFVRAIPYNFYALLTIVMMVGMVLIKTEFGSMKFMRSMLLKETFIQQRGVLMRMQKRKARVNPTRKSDRSCDSDRVPCDLLCDRYDLYRRIFQRNRFCHCVFSERCICRSDSGKLI